VELPQVLRAVQPLLPEETRFLRVLAVFKV
jgi:hypothetical protein